MEKSSSAERTILVVKMRSNTMDFGDKCGCGAGFGVMCVGLKCAGNQLFVLLFFQAGVFSINKGPKQA